jgi:hypothetical protein
LKFEQVGNATVEFTGKPRRKTVSDFNRGNLPDPVLPGVTYRDIDVRLVITTTFEELGRVITGILGGPVREGRQQIEEQTDQRQKSSAADKVAPPSRKPGGRQRR